jgi:hypothetical protein
MKHGSRLACVLLLAFGLIVVAGAKVACGDTKETPAGASGQGNSDQMSPEDMKMMMELATPGEHHKSMDRLVGTWKASIKMWMGPGEPTVSDGTVKYEWVLGGRYLRSTHSGNFNDMPFEGMEIDGYDNAKQQYFSVWFDNMGTGMMTTTGQASDDGKTITYTGAMYDPMQKKDIATREEIRWVNDKSYVRTMYVEAPGENGTMQDKKVMEITATKM